MDWEAESVKTGAASMTRRFSTNVWVWSAVEAWTVKLVAVWFCDGTPESVPLVELKERPVGSDGVMLHDAEELKLTTGTWKTLVTLRSTTSVVTS